MLPYLVEPAVVLEQDSGGDDIAVTFTQWQRKKNKMLLIKIAGLQSGCPVADPASTYYWRRFHPQPG